MPGYISPEKLDFLVQKGDPKEFLIIDVRRLEEYALDHIPGAIHIPVHEVESRQFSDRELTKLIFYCRNGCRSKVAALIAMESGLPDFKLFTLEGGMAAYTGEILLEMPKLDLFSPYPEETLNAFVNFEKGAFRFYNHAARLFQGTAIHGVLKQMAGFEKAHAKNLFVELNGLKNQSLLFEEFFEACSGDILEGGKSFIEIQSWQDKTSGNVEAILDLALEIELTAYDLYKAMSGYSEDPDIQGFFLELARSEKIHMNKILALIKVWESSLKNSS